MVSALTDRLFSGYSSSGTNSSGGAASGKNASSGGTKPANDSGYSADQEQPSAAKTPPLFYIELLTRHRKRGSPSDNSSLASDEKRTRIEDAQEVNYLAHMVSQELVRGGHLYPEINTEKPRMLPTNANVDMRGVTLVHSKDYFGAPPAARKSSQSSSSHNNNPNNNPHNMMSLDLGGETLQSIIKACAPHYQTTTTSRVNYHPFPKPAGVLTDTSDGASTTSSVTEEEAEDAATENPSISMGQALTISKQPRIIVVADASYTIVHCNAPFLAMTGSGSSKILGRPLTDALHEQTLDWGPDSHNLHNLSNALQTTKTLHLKSSTPGRPALVCPARLSPIGSQPDAVTHFSIELEAPAQADDKSWMTATEGVDPSLKVVA